MKLAIPGLGFSRNIEEIAWGEIRNKWNFRGQSRKNHKEFGFIPKRSHTIVQDFQGWTFVLSGISKGEVTPRNSSGYKKVCPQPPHPVPGVAQFTNTKPISDDIFVGLKSWTIYPFLQLLFILSYLFIQTCSQSPDQRFMVFSTTYILIR